VPVNYYDLVAWPFLAEDLNHIFDPTDQNITIEIYSNGTYYGSSSLGTSFDPNYIIQPGQSFFILNAGTVDTTYTLTGTNNQATTYSVALTTGEWNAVGPAYYRSTNDFIECVFDSGFGGYRYTHASWNYTNTVGDLIYQWSIESQGWKPNAVGTDPNHNITPFYTNSISDTSTTICSGRGLFIKPAASKTWVQTLALHKCDSSGQVDVGSFVCPP